jgi:transcriptional regulator with XRE-family HTH domain
MSTVLVKNADRMMTSVNPLEEGIELTFADGCKGLIPFAEIPEIQQRSNLSQIELQNPYEILLRDSKGEGIEIPWDFARHYCDPGYQSRVEAVALSGRHTLGGRVRQLRESAGLTQEALAHTAGIARITLLRLENGEYSPRFETLAALAQALRRPVEQLLVGERGLGTEVEKGSSNTLATLQLNGASVSQIDTETWKHIDQERDSERLQIAA